MYAIGLFMDEKINDKLDYLNKKIFEAKLACQREEDDPEKKYHHISCVYDRQAFWLRQKIKILEEMIWGGSYGVE